MFSKTRSTISRVLMIESLIIYGCNMTNTRAQLTNRPSGTRMRYTLSRRSRRRNTTRWRQTTTISSIRIPVKMKSTRSERTTSASIQTIMRHRGWRKRWTIITSLLEFLCMSRWAKVGVKSRLWWCFSNLFSWGSKSDSISANVYGWDLELIVTMKTS